MWLSYGVLSAQKAQGDIMVWGILLLLAAVAVVALLTWKSIKQWFVEKTVNTTSYGELIKNRLQSGDYSIIAGVFKKNGVKAATKEWQAKELDQNLRDKFSDRNRIVVNVANFD